MSPKKPEKSTKRPEKRGPGRPKIGATVAFTQRLRPDQVEALAAVARPGESREHLIRLAVDDLIARRRG